MLKTLQPASEATRIRLNFISSRIISASYKVGSYFGAGFAEKIYVNALKHVLLQDGLEVDQEHKVRVFYHATLVGIHRLDLLVDKAVVVEAKALQSISDGALAQTKNYLVATNLRLGLVVNFGTPSVQVKRVVNQF